MNLGDKIKECRKQAGLSQEQLAERLNVSRQAITKWETNKGIPDIANLIAISDEFGLSLDELIKDDVAVK
ncbi:helix-turn-helix domain-containing protein [Bifidobacterium catenulatum subsp. kashiwanohense]|nr:helix-turn-helix domain-containing protein [Bifidobacterium catenulatum subsp. kashiwanohense]